MQHKSFSKNLLGGIRKRISGLFNNPYKEVNLNWLKLKYYKHLPPGNINVHQLFGKQLYFNSPAELIHGFNEIFLAQMYKQTLREKPFIIDCGANIGLSIIYMKRLYPDAEIIAFEPDEKNYELLSRNIRSFGFSDVILHKEAVWIENSTLHFSNEGSMASKIEGNKSDNTKEVSAIRLKNVITREIDFLKIDIEGAEFAVIKDISEQLHLVKNMFVEYHGSFDQNNELSQLINLFVKAGFSYYIKEASAVYATPLSRTKNPENPYDVQLNIFCFRAGDNS